MTIKKASQVWRQTLDKIILIVYTLSITGGNTMSKAISLKINDSLFTEAEDLIHKTAVPRNFYINQAIRYYNRIIKRKLLKQHYQKESSLLAAHSLEINQEFQKIEDEIPGLK
jgi:hypothetical protein